MFFQGEQVGMPCRWFAAILAEPAFFPGEQQNHEVEGRQFSNVAFPV